MAFKLESLENLRRLKEAAAYAGAAAEVLKLDADGDGVPDLIEFARVAPNLINHFRDLQATPEYKKLVKEVDDAKELIGLDIEAIQEKLAKAQA